MPTPRPHYKERIAHAEGHEIEVRVGEWDLWTLDSDPEWFDNWEYRVKDANRKPDVVQTAHATLDVMNELYFLDRNEPNLRLTFDGETGTLKSAEVIQQS
jgi:hypothetical protein